MGADRVEIRVELEEPERTFGPREPIAGTVVVSSERAWFCDQLTVSLTLKTTSIGYDAQSTPKTVPVFTGKLAPGQTRVPFETLAPRFPANYEGGIFQIRWSVTATARCYDPEVIGSEAFESSASAPLAFALDPDAGLSVRPARPGSKALVNRGAGAGRWFFAILAGLAAAGLAAGIVFASAVAVIVLGIHAVLFSAFAVSMFRAHRLNGIVGTPQLAIETRQAGGYRDSASPGARELTVWCKPGAPIAEVRAHTRVFERVETGSATTENHTVRRAKLWEDATRLQLGSPGEWQGTLSLPLDQNLPYSLSAGKGNSIEWRSTIEVELDDGNTVEEDVALRARPPGDT